MKKGILIFFLFLSIIGNIYLFSKSEKGDTINSGTGATATKTGSVGNETKKDEPVLPPAPISLLDIYKKDPKGFDIDKYEKNPLNRELYKDCSEYTEAKAKKGFDSAKFLTKDIESELGFDTKIDCKAKADEEYCKFIKDYATAKPITLNEVKYLLYALYNKDITEDGFKNLFSDTQKFDVGENIGSQMKFIELYFDMINGNIGTTEDCIKFISKKGNTLLK